MTFLAEYKKVSRTFTPVVQTGQSHTPGGLRKIPAGRTPLDRSMGFAFWGVVLENQAGEGWNIKTRIPIIRIAAEESK